MSIQKVIDHFGSQKAVAKAISDECGVNITQQAVALWVKNGRVPAIRAKQINIISNGLFPRESLCPDIFC